MQVSDFHMSYYMGPLQSEKERGHYKVIGGASGTMSYFLIWRYMFVF